MAIFIDVDDSVSMRFLCLLLFHVGIHTSSVIADDKMSDFHLDMNIVSSLSFEIQLTWLYWWWLMFV